MAPMAKCVACGKFLSSTGVATCSKCPCKYHKGCVGVADGAAISRDWVCPECKTKQKRGDNSGTPVKDVSGAQTVSVPVTVQPSPGVPSPPKDLESGTFRRELAEYMAEQRLFRDEIRASLNKFEDRMGDIERRLDALENRETEMMPEHRQVEALKKTVAQLQLELNDRDQDMLLSDLDIGHIPEEKGESVVHTVTVLAAKLGVQLEARDIIFAERAGGPPPAGAAAGGSGGKPRRVVVRLARRQTRDDLLQAARVRRNITSADVGLPGPPMRLYINERLTRSNRQLFHRVRGECLKHSWRFSWTRRGRIYARQSDGKPAICFRSDADVQRVFGASSQSSQ